MLEKFIPLANPDIRDEDIAQVVAVLKSGMLINGKYAAQLEQEWALFTQTTYASAVSNGTATMHIALKALNIGPGDEVIIPALSYVATANVVELVGATCVFVDVDENTFTIDAEKIEEKITSKTKAIIPVHEFGLAANMTAICAIAQKHNLYIIEDAACALGATHGGKPVGGFGDFGSFSLHPRKSITSGEGGMITTNNENYQRKNGILRNHGVEMIDGKMEFVEAGFNYRMTDFQAALALSQFQRLKETLIYKQELAEVYFNEIKTSNVTLPFVPSTNNHTWQTYHILIDDNISQQELIQKLKENNIGVNYGAQCIPSQKYYQNKYNLDGQKLFPNAYRAFTKGIALPLYEKLTKEDISQISKVINQIC